MNGLLVEQNSAELGTGVLNWLQDLRQEVFALREEVADLRRENAELRRENAELRRENLELRQQVGYWKSRHADAAARVVKLEAEVAQLRGENRQLQARLTELEVTARSANALKARINHASFPVEKDFETFDFSVGGVPPKQKLLELARGEWVEQKFNLCLVGSSGTGKTHLAIALGLAASRMAQHDAENVGLLALAVGHDDRRAGAEIDLGFLAGSAFQATEGPGCGVAESAHEAFNAVVLAGEVVLGHSSLGTHPKNSKAWTKPCRMASVRSLGKAMANG